MTDSQDDPPAAADPLEAELRTFRPTGPSRELFARVETELARDLARDLAHDLAARRTRAWPWLAGSLLAAAACIVVAVLLWQSSRSPGRSTVAVATTAPAAVTPVTEPDDDRPALASYRRALSRSPEALDELLDRHAARLLPGAGGGGAAASFRVTAAPDAGALR